VDTDEEVEDDGNVDRGALVVASGGAATGESSHGPKGFTSQYKVSAVKIVPWLT
jgi:hypothetical protein